MNRENLYHIGTHIEKAEAITRDELLAHFAETFNAGQVDREIERLIKHKFISRIAGQLVWLGKENGNGQA